MYPQVEVRGRENPDWSCARTLRSALLVDSAEWVQSVYSSRFRLHENELVAPNRDYPYEGLLVHQDGENWKFIDCIAIGVRSEDGRPLPFDDASTDSVRVSPWEATYHYQVLEDHGAGHQQTIPFSVSYRLFSECPPEFAAGRIIVRFPDAASFAARRLRVLVQPLLEIRHMFGGSDLGRYWTECLAGAVSRTHVSNEDHTITFCCASAKANRFHWPEAVPWWYKLGSGGRTECGGVTSFAGEERHVGAFFNLELDITRRHSAATVFFSCSVGGRCCALSITDYRRIAAASLHHDRAQLALVRGLIPAGSDSHFVAPLVARVVGLTKFKIRVRSTGARGAFCAPYAGAWWFKTPWYRDVFEGILSSFDVLMAMEGERAMIAEVLHLALSQQDRTTGLAPNRISEFKGVEPTYNSADATLLSFIAGCRYVSHTQDAELARSLLRAAGYTLRGFLHTNAVEPVEDGPPRVDPATGLLLTAPQHSWMDTRAQTVDYGGHRLERLPSRLSARFIKDLCDRFGGAALAPMLASPRFLLPEINAQWIIALRGMLALADAAEAAESAPGAAHKHVQLRASARSVLDRAEACYVPTFWNDDTGFLFNAVFEDLSCRDAMESEASITAAAMLGLGAFSREQLARLWRHAASTLLVYRRSGAVPQPFGVLATNADRRIFYGDIEYHADVVWPRSTPYLVKLLELLGETETLRQVLAANLEHQMGEGAVFYNHELLARPCGNNSSPEEPTGRDPVPVKNPIQFWSQWCDPFFTYLQEVTHGKRDAR
jgi:hypothetical protein